MAITNHERVGKALELLKDGLGPFVERELKNGLQGGLSPQTLREYADDPMLANKLPHEWDVAALLKLMWDTWQSVFRIPWARRNAA